MKVAAVVSDLILFSRIEAAARVADARLYRVDRPHDVPRDAELVLVDWSAREADWASVLARLPARVLVFGPHTDRQAHTDARSGGVGPMIARSKLVADLPRLLAAGT